jgi:hypothetical protein
MQIRGLIASAISHGETWIQPVWASAIYCHFLNHTTTTGAEMKNILRPAIEA